MTINHLVLCGGGPIGVVQYGILKKLSQENIIKLDEITSIYATSVGGFIAFIYMLNFDWECMDDFIIKRPWENLFKLGISDYLNIFYTKGLISINMLIEALKPLYLAKNIPIDITMHDFYELTNINFNLVSCNLNTFTKQLLNHNTTPDLKVYEAIYMSLTIPILFQPFYYNNNYYLDGGIFVNCPTNDCIHHELCTPDYENLLVITNDRREQIDPSNEFYKNDDVTNNDTLNNESNFFEYIIYIFKTLFNKIALIENENSIEIFNSINTCLHSSLVHLKYWHFVASDKQEREHLIKLGAIQAEKYIEKLNTVIDPSLNDVSTDLI